MMRLKLKSWFQWNVHISTWNVKNAQNFHSNLLVSWELVTLTRQGNSLVCMFVKFRFVTVDFHINNIPKRKNSFLNYFISFLCFCDFSYSRLVCDPPPVWLTLASWRTVPCVLISLLDCYEFWRWSRIWHQIYSPTGLNPMQNFYFADYSRYGNSPLCLFEKQQWGKWQFDVFFFYFWTIVYLVRLHVTPPSMEFETITNHYGTGNLSKIIYWNVVTPGLRKFPKFALHCTSKTC